MNSNMALTIQFYFLKVREGQFHVAMEKFFVANNKLFQLITNNEKALLAMLYDTVPNLKNIIYFSEKKRN